MTVAVTSKANLGETTIWNGVDRLIDASPGLRDLQAHGLHLLAARRWRSLGKPVPPELAWAELWAAQRVHAAGWLLARIREACLGPILLIKGPAVAARYPDAALRPFLDLDLLVEEPDAAQKALLAAGFEPVRSRLHPETGHHLHPLQLRGFPLSIELHRHPKWIAGLRPPSLDDLLACSEPATDLRVDGILTLPPAEHALVLVAHLWSHDPLARLLRILDVAVMADAADSRELDRLVDAWRLAMPWEATAAVADSLFRGGSSQPFPLKTWARNLTTAREATVFEMHVARCLAPFSILPPHRAVRESWAALIGCLRPQPYESWSDKLRRTAQQVQHPSMRRSEHARGAETSLREPETLAETEEKGPAVSPPASIGSPGNSDRPEDGAASGKAKVVTSSLVWLAASTLWGAAAVLAVALDIDPVYRAPILLTFLLLVPGLALARLLGIPALTAQVSLAVALSIALDILVPAALLYAGAWSPSVALWILAGLTTGAAAVEVLLRGAGGVGQVGVRPASR